MGVVTVELLRHTHLHSHGQKGSRHLKAVAAVGYMKEKAVVMGQIHFQLQYISCLLKSTAGASLPPCLSLSGFCLGAFKRVLQL